VKVAFVIQRYGAEVAGGSEAHCRGLVNALKDRHEVEVLTTCALDYITWKNHFPPGKVLVDGVPVTRYRNRRERDITRFSLISDRVFLDEHTRADQEKWIVENGPVCPDLIRAVESRRDIDFFICYSFRYYSAALAARAVPDRAILLPTAEDDPAVHMSIFAELFRSVRGMLYLTPEEQELVEEVAGKLDSPSEIIGCGMTMPSVDRSAADRFKLPSTYVAYAGRIDLNKGVDKLFEYYQWLLGDWPDCPPLVLAGHQVLDIPVHPKIRYIGYVSDAEKAALLAGASIVLLPSALESLSIIVLEAWAVGTPVLVNAKCRVLEGQCKRSNGGLWYRDLAEFATMMRMLMARPDLRRDLGAAGGDYVRREYSWEIAASRTEALLARLPKR
jgi:glycosyltransferase involved in cell wall biosynthesis